MRPIIVESESGFEIKLICLNKKCKKEFWADANEPIKNVKCTYCGSHEHKEKTR